MRSRVKWMTESGEAVYLSGRFSKFTMFDIFVMFEKCKFPLRLHPTESPMGSQGTWAPLGSKPPWARFGTPGGRFKEWVGFWLIFPAKLASILDLIWHPRALKSQKKSSVRSLAFNKFAPRAHPEQARGQSVIRSVNTKCFEAPKCRDLSEFYSNLGSFWGPMGALFAQSGAWEGLKSQVEKKHQKMMPKRSRE